MKFKNLGHRISVLRKEKNLTQAELAKLVGISRPVMVKVENGQRAISLDEGEAISKALGISIDSLLDYEKEDSEERTFVRAFKAKGIQSPEQEKEIERYELLFDALCTQEIIYKGE